MANIRYFAECRGEPVQLAHVQHDGSRSTRAHAYQGVCPACGQRHRALRKVEIKRNPSRHACDPRCLNANGLIMRCECQCGGRNHGRGTLSSTDIRA
jgi:hypothetical protein